MDKLAQISVENTVTVKVDCQLNQQLLAKNFQIIMDCLKDLKSEQDKHSSSLNELFQLKQNFNHFKDQVNNQAKSRKNSESKNDSNKVAHDGNGKQGQHESSSVNNNNNGGSNVSQGQLNDLMHQIKQLKNRTTKNEGFINQNTKDINLLLQDMKQAKEDIETLKKMVSKINQGSNDKGEVSSGNIHNFVNHDSVNNIMNECKHNSQDIDRLFKQLQTIKNSLKKLQKLQKDLNDLLNSKQVSSVNINQQSQKSNSNQSNNNDSNSKSLNDIIKKIQQLNKKVQALQGQTNSNTQSIYDLNDLTEKHTQDINQAKDNLNNVHQEIQDINAILEQIQNIHNEDITNLNNQIDKLRQEIERIASMNAKGKISNLGHQGEGSSHEGSSKQLGKDRSFRKRADSTTHKEDPNINAKLNELNSRLTYLEKVLSKMQSEENPQKLPSLSNKKNNATFYNGEKSKKKELAEIKNELQVWIKAYLNNQNKNNGNVADLQLKIQEIKNILGKKADEETMKKGLAFLQGKITHLYLFLTQPDAEDAMIVRKGFNCLSCSKKVQTLRGKLGPRMNWDNLNNHNHTPPKNSFPKYADSTQKDSI